MASFGLKIRIPSWSKNFKCSIPGKSSDGWYVISSRPWTKSKIQLDFNPQPLFPAGTGTNKDRHAYTFGPFVMAQIPEPSKETQAEYRKRKVPFSTTFIEDMEHGNPKTVYSIPFAEVTGRYHIWSQTDSEESLFQDSAETRSARGNVQGSICDGDEGTFVVTYDGTLQKEASFTVTRESAVSISRIAFTHGQTFHDGGWFVNDGQGPRIEVQERRDGPWVSLGSLPNYPRTTISNPAGLKPGQKFDLVLPKKMKVLAIRVVGTPASGDNPKQSFSSCGELQAFP